MMGGKAVLGLAAGAVVIVLTPVVIMFLGIMSVTGTAAAGVLTVATAGDRLRPDAPIPGQFLPWVIRGGAVCDGYGPAWLAAQIDLESSWNPNAFADNPPENGGPAMGIAQFQQGTWDTWGRDYDNDGINSPYDPEDGIMAMAHLMCANLAWAQQMIDEKRVRGDVMDIALAAYFCGRGCILEHGGVPADGLSHDYPIQVRERLPKYGTAGNIIAVAEAEMANPVRNHEVNGTCNFYAGVMRPWTRSFGSCPGEWGYSSWCADFAKYVWLNAGGIDVDGLDGWAQSFRAYGERRGTWHPRGSGYVPKAGDAIVYDWDKVVSDDHPIDHVGLVAYVKDGWVHTIEGNVGGEGRGRVDRRSHPLTDTDIMGYTSPVPGS